MRVLVAAMGSRGDVQPALTLALALRDAGHEARVSAPPDFAAWAGQLGLEFASAGASIEETLKQNAARIGGNPLALGRAIREVLLQHVPGMTERTLAAAEGRDAIVSANQFMARTVAEVLGMPFIGVIYTPTLIRSSSHPPLLARWQSAPAWVNRLLWRAADPMASRIFLEPINIERAKRGLSRVRSFEAHHGGSGTTSAALRAGVPQVIVPHFLDQYYFAHRLKVLGLAPPGIPVRKLGPARLAAAIDATLALPPAPRLEAAARLRPGDGLSRAVAHIEERVGARAHGSPGGV